MKLASGQTGAIALALGAFCSGCAQAQTRPAPAPGATGATEHVTVVSATRQINALTIDRDGGLWAATGGGVLRRDAAGRWQKWNMAQGLPSHEVLRIELKEGSIIAHTPRGAGAYHGGSWRRLPHIAKASEGCVISSATGAFATPATVWMGKRVTGRGELIIGQGSTARRVELPAGRGSHITALVAQGDRLWAALYGDAVWSYDGQHWSRLNWKLPAGAREVTALAEHEGAVWLGTRQNGIWGYDGRTWRQHLAEDEPFDVNIQNMAAWRGELWCSTLESGLVRFDGRRWRHMAAPEISTDAPRQLAAFNGALWVRHGGGHVDRWNGGVAWELNALSFLPRGKAYALAADTRKLYVGQWGGWSEFDGRQWAHHLRLPELQGVIVQALLPDGDNLWIGTQTRGLGYFNRRTGALSWTDERHGLQDDWITALGKHGTAVYAGTFVGGLAERAGTNSRWHNVEPLRGLNVTAIEAGQDGSLFAATRHGLWRRPAGGTAWQNLNAEFAALDSEVQALCPAEGGMWAATRTGLFFVRDGLNAGQGSTPPRN